MQRPWGQRETGKQCCSAGPSGAGLGEKGVAEGSLRVGREKSWGTELVIDKAG